MDTLYAIPNPIEAGNTIAWERTYSASDFPAADWTAKCHLKLIGSSAVTTITATESGETFTFTITAAVSAALTVGDYEWVEVVEKGEGASIERYEQYRGTTTVRRFLGTSGTVDSRSTVRVIFEAIEAVLQGRASQDQQSYSIAGRSLERTPIADLLKLRQFYASEVAREDKETAIANGNAPSGKIRIRFIEPT